MNEREKLKTDVQLSLKRIFKKTFLPLKRPSHSISACNPGLKKSKLMFYKSTRETCTIKHSTVPQDNLHSSLI